MNVIKMVAGSLKSNGFDGLYNEYENCACELDDLAPCIGIQSDCVAGYRYWCEDADCEFTADVGKHWHTRSTK